jgi:hypothetical protein
MKRKLPQYLVWPVNFATEPSEVSVTHSSRNALQTIRCGRNAKGGVRKEGDRELPEPVTLTLLPY